MEFQSELHDIFLRLQPGTLSRLDRNRLVFLCTAIAKSALISYHRRTAELLASHGWNLEDLALDCVANLFETNSQGAFIKLHHFLEHLNAPLAEISDCDFFLAFKAFLNRFVHLRLVKILGEADPEGRRIARNIRAALRRRGCSARLCVDFRGEVLIPAGGDLNAHLPEYPPSQFHNALSSEIHSNSKIPQILERVVDVLTGQSSYRSSIRLIDLVQVLKQLYSGVFLLEQDSESHIEVGQIESRDFAPLRLSTLRMIADKLEISYVRKAKVSASEARGLLLSLSYILDDWFAGIAIDHQYFPYLQKGFGCSKEDYEDRWATLVSYFVRLAREHIRQELDEEV